MDTPNRCVPDGMTVGPAGDYPADPTEFRWPNRQPACGCTKLVCLLCKADVKARLGFFLPLEFGNRPLVPDLATKLHNLDDWTQVPGVEVSTHHRLYACRCFYYSESSASFTFNPDDVDEMGRGRRNLPWTCQGHPPADLPIMVDGRILRDVAEVSALVKEALTDSTRIEWLRGLFHRTHHGALESVVPDVVARAAEGPAPLDPSLKSLCASETALAPLSAFVEEVLRYQRGLSKPDAKRREDLVDVLSAAVWQRPSGVVEAGTITVLQDEALQGAITISQLKMFETHDREWLIAHVEDLVARRPDQAGGILALAGRAMVWLNADPAPAVQRLAVIARASGVAADALLTQARASMGDMFRFDNGRGPILEIIERMKSL